METGGQDISEEPWNCEVAMLSAIPPIHAIFCCNTSPRSLFIAEVSTVGQKMTQVLSPKLIFNPLNNTEEEEEEILAMALRSMKAHNSSNGSMYYCIKKCLFVL